jgi:hypothetical protein
MKPGDIKDIIEILGAAEEFRPLVKAVLDVIRSYEPELGEVRDMFKSVGAGMIESRVKSIEKYEELGCTREEALLLVIDQRVAIETALSKVRK